MYKKIITIALLVLGIIAISLADVSAEDIPVLKDVQVISSIMLDESSGLYEYSYEVSNSQASTGQIFMVEIDISRPPQSRELSADGLVIYKGLNWRGEMRQVSFESKLAVLSGRLLKPIVPIGGEPPSGWSFDIALRGTASWGSSGKTNRIMSGYSLDGFKLISRGIPSIRDVAIHPKWVLVVEGYVSEEDEEKARHIEEEITFRTKTIGPTAPPEELVPADFLQNIIDMKHEAFELGWITNKGIERSLDAKLDAAKKKLAAGNTKATGNILKAFIHEVEAQGCENYDDCPRGKHLTPEAYALLKYNAQYLMDNLGK